MLSVSCDDPVHAILISSCSSCQSGWHWGGRAGGSGPRLRPRQDRERHREGGLMMLMSESHVCPVWGLNLITLWGCLYRNLRTELAQGFRAGQQWS